jgi:hypothetical protein
MIKNFFKFILSKLTDHLVGLGLGLLITSSAVLEFFTKIKPLSGFLVPFILSRWSDLLLFVVLLIFTARHYWSNHRNYGSDKIPNPPKYHASHDGKIEEREYEGVIWKLLVGTNQNPSKGEIRREGIIVWPHPNPYCIQCDFELGRIRNKWYCLPCKKRYKIPHDLRHQYTETS